MSEKQIKGENKSSHTFPYYRFSGTHKQIGKQYGEACKELIRKHLDSVYAHLQNNYRASVSQIAEEALKYRPFVKQYAAFLDEEIQGIAEGADLSLGEAYILQVRAELNYQFQHYYNECTSFAISPEATSDGAGLVGQNVDLPAFYAEVGVVIEIVPDEGIPCLMYTPAGQISYIGVNNVGLGVFGNYLACDGWQLGLPRYMYSRLALNCDSVEGASNVLHSIQRSSAQNLIMMDQYGKSVNLEVTPTKIGEIQPTNGILTHSNHFIGEGMLEEERTTPEKFENSCARLECIREQLGENHGKISIPILKKILEDRSSYPHCINRLPGDGDEESSNTPNEVITIASIVAEPSSGKFWIAVGPAEKQEYVCYTLN